MKYLLLLAAAAGLSGCAVSLQPFYTSASIVDDRSIEGRWTDGDASWLVTRVAPGRSEIAECGDGGADCKADTIAVLFRTAGVTFLDFTEKPESPLNTGNHLHGLFEIRVNKGANRSDGARERPDREAGGAPRLGHRICRRRGRPDSDREARGSPKIRRSSSD